MSLDQIPAEQNIQWSQLMDDIDKCPTTFDKLVLILQSFHEDEKYGEQGLRYFCSEGWESKSDYTRKLSIEIRNELESLKTASDLDVFFSKLWGIITIGMGEEEKQLFIYHGVAKFLFMPVMRLFVDKWPRDSSALDKWYVLAKYLIECSNIEGQIRRVYEKNINDPASQKFYEDFLRQHPYYKEAWKH